MTPDSNEQDPNWRAEWVRNFLDAVQAMPSPERTRAIHDLLSTMIRVMPTEAIHLLRAEIAREFTGDLPIVESSLNLIDGQLAIREMGADL